jgi:hypothetical protein
MIITIDFNTSDSTWSITSIDMPDFTASGDSLPGVLRAAATAAEQWLGNPPPGEIPPD